jgi:uncharacterized membrane protein YecN with MAPEG domain
MSTAILCIALLAILVFGLGFAVSIVRGRTDIVYGHPDDPTNFLHKIVRAHGNTVEYAGMLAVLMLVLGGRGAEGWVAWCMYLVTASRYLIVAGLLLGPSLAKPHPLRFLGALGTYAGGLALAAAVFITG